MVRKMRKTRKQNLHGGFYPSVIGGLGNTLYLAPLAIRAGIRMVRNNKKTRKQRKQQKRKERKTRKH
jgi:hypothetical protein